MYYYKKIEYSILTKNLIHLGFHKKKRSTHAQHFVFSTPTRDIINTNVTTIQLKKVLYIISNIIKNKGQLYIVAPNLKIQNYDMKLSKKYGQNFFCNNWKNGLITNFKYLTKESKMLSNKQYPNAIFLLNYPKTSYLEYEITKIGILTTQLINSHTKINKTLYPIPGNTQSPQTTFFFIKIIIEMILHAYTQEQVELISKKKTDKKDLSKVTTSEKDPE